MKDSAIKLFGRTISLPHNRKVSANDSSSDHSPPSYSSSPGELSSATKHEAERIEVCYYITNVFCKFKSDPFFHELAIVNGFISKISF